MHVCEAAAGQRGSKKLLNLLGGSSLNLCDNIYVTSSYDRKRRHPVPASTIRLAGISTSSGLNSTGSKG